MTVKLPAVWFPTIRTGAGTDVFTERLVSALQARNIRAEITWLPLRAEYAPWTVRIPQPPTWATICHINTWLHPRFIPSDLPVIATLHHSVHDPALRPYKGWMRAAYHRWWIASIERKALRRADEVVAVSQFVADVGCQTLCTVPMQVIYNGIDTELFHPINREHQPGEPFRLLYVGSWMRRKGVDLLAPIMRELGRGFELHYTRGSSPNAYERSIPSNMHDSGRLTNGLVIAAMQNADAFLFPSRSEGFGLVAAEAMACGLPVIATRGSSLLELIDDGITGVLCAQDDVSAFVTAIKRLAADPERTHRMSSAARNESIQRFEIGGMVQAYLDLYRRLVEV